MNTFIEYFVSNKRLNYALLFFLAYLGYHAYINIPKEMFPVVALDKISVKGSYVGASASNMDKMVVRDIEDELNNINGINKTETTITPGSFIIILTLNENSNRINVLSKVKDSIALSKQYLPSDMDEPIAKLIDKNKPLVNVAVSSDTLTINELTVVAQDIKSKFSQMKDISEISIRGDSDEEILISINTDAIMAYDLNPLHVVNAISNLSSIFPIGKIEEAGSFAFISTSNGKENISEYKESTLDINGKFIRLGDIAEVKIHHPQTKTLSTFNNKKTLTLVISKGEKGDAIQLSQNLRERMKKLEKNYKGVRFHFYKDSSHPIKSRLDTVVSNLMFGLILVFLSMFILINLRIAFIVTLGIPFSFIIGLLFIYYMGYSINIVSLLGALIVIGIVVDDAIVVGENIQRHIDEGMDNYKASIVGVKEMLLPITLATLTTAAAFLPMFMMQGEIALFLILVPIVVVMILIGSLLESFFFLPLHASELLKKSKNFVDWTPFQNLYERVLKFNITYKKVFVLLFIILIPFATFMTAKSMKFQFFPNFDGSYIYISGKMDINTPIEETFTIAKEIEKALMSHAKEFSIKTTSMTTGYRRSISGETELNNNVFYITLELHDRVKTNWVDRYINPVLNFSFDFEHEGEIREKKTFLLAPRASEIIAPFKKKYKMVDLGVQEDRAGLIKSDIQINLSGSDDKELEDAVRKISKEIALVEGIVNFSDNIRYGKMEYKIKINSYGAFLGLSEASISQVLSHYFLQKRQTTTFNASGVMEIKTQDTRKDNIQTLLDFNLPLNDGTFVTLADVADIIKIRDYEKINKLNGNIVKIIYAKVDKRLVTPSEVLVQLEDVLSEVANEGVEVHLLGEKEKNKQLKGDMKNTVVLALFLIFITLLLIFSKIKYVLMLMSVIPLSVLGVFLGHMLLGINLTMPSMIGILGLAGVVINDGIIMLDFLHGTRKAEEFFTRAKHRLRPIIITSVTTFLGLFTLIFYASGQAVILQPIAISIGFGLLWGTVLNLVYLPTLYALVNGIKVDKVK
ncbi:efflux RND transporter permease subunit [Sulfurimonas sp. SAG-AH-194-I05]|nr:efflux RND transporter permease subunit [Sulfurimonas sp. SAG-AH-194-I05]MDF1874482.1 efflux RND transporter permease subunit [Sulfurimonas sp. SAG-AH-194-I05]